MELYRKKESAEEKAKGKEKRRGENGGCVYSAPFHQKSVHVLQDWKKEATGHDKVVVEKQPYVAEVGIFRKCLLYVWMCKGI